MKYRYLFHPEDFCVGENERFYSDMAKKGWRLEKRGRYLSRFARSDPAGELYRIELGFDEPTEEQLAIYRECGWEFVTKRSYVNVFSTCESSHAPEFYSDPAEQGETVRRMRRKMRVSSLVSVVLLAAFLAILYLAGGERVNGDLWANVVKAFLIVPEMVVFYVSVILIDLAVEIEGSVRIDRLIRRLGRGEPIDHSPKLRLPVLAWARTVIIVLCALTLVVQLAMLHRTEKLPEVSDGVYITLSELGYEGERRGIFSDEDNSHLSRGWSPLADMVETRETVYCDEDWVSLDQEIYRLRVPGLSRAFARALIYSSTFSRDPKEYQEIDVPGYDSVMAAYMECIAIRGNAVVRIYMLMPDGIDWEERTDNFSRALRLIGEKLDGK